MKTFCRLILCSCVVVLVSCTRKYDRPGDAAFELVDALVAADVDRAKSVTVSEQWDRIEEWMQKREPFICQGGTWDGTGISGSGFRAADNEWDYGAVYQCASQRTPYCLRVNDILVRETVDGWKVYDWGSICEASDYAIGCVELCGPRPR
jgi:hypothetical protein